MNRLTPWEFDICIFGYLGICIFGGSALDHEGGFESFIQKMSNTKIWPQYVDQQLDFDKGGSFSVCQHEPNGTSLIILIN